MTHSIIFRSYGAYTIIVRPLDYKYFVPTGLRPLFSSCFVIRHNSNTLTEHNLTLGQRPLIAINPVQENLSPQQLGLAFNSLAQAFSYLY